MSWHPADGCAACTAIAERAKAARFAAAADLIAAEGDPFFAAHPEIVTAAHAYAERMRQGATS